MKSLIAACLMLVALSSTYACDSYNPATNQLTIPIGSMPTTANGTTVFTNTVITVGGLVGLDNGPASHSYDTYTLWTNQLAIPCVQVGNQTYTNVTITVGSAISVGAIYDSPVPPVLDVVDSLPPATVGQAYLTNVVDGIYPDSMYTYMIDTLAIGNGVPTGMTLNMNGILSGTPFATGRTDVNGNQIPHTYTFGVCAVDTISRAMTTPCPLTSIVVNPAQATTTPSIVISSVTCTVSDRSYTGDAVYDLVSAQGSATGAEVASLSVQPYRENADITCANWTGCWRHPGEPDTTSWSASWHTGFFGSQNLTATLYLDNQMFNGTLLWASAGRTVNVTKTLSCPSR